MLFGKYVLTSNYDDLFCWKRPNSINVDSETQSVLLEQAGYKLKYELSHKNVALRVVEMEGTKSVLFARNVLGETDMKSEFCVPRAASYGLFLESCHKFTEGEREDFVSINAEIFKKGQNEVRLSSMRTQVVVDVVFKLEEGNQVLRRISS